MIKNALSKHLTFIFVILFSLITLAIAACHTNPDNDMWWMMSTGRYIVENKEIPVTNPFVIHENFAIIVQQWLLAITNYALYSAFGKWGLASFAYLAFLINCVLVFRLSAHFANNTNTRLLAVIIGIVLCGTYLNTRPTQLTIGILLLCQLAILNWKETQKIKWLAAIPLLSVVEINIHAALWPFLFVTILPHIVPNPFLKNIPAKQQIRKSFPLITLSIAGILAGFANPNGSEGVLYLFKSYGSSELFQSINELQSPQIASLYGVVVVGAVVLLSLYLKRYCTEDAHSSIDVSKVCMLAGVALLSSMHLRNIWTLLFGVIPVVCELMPSSFLEGRFFSKREVVIFSAIYTLILVAGVFIMTAVPTNECTSLPTKAADYLDTIKNENEVRLYTTFNSGGYMEWRGYQVYIDARPELFQKKVNKTEDIADEYYKVATGTADYKSFLNKYNFTHILTEENGYFDLYLKTSGSYSKVLKSNGYVLYEK